MAEVYRSGGYGPLGDLLLVMVLMVMLIMMMTMMMIFDNGVVDVVVVAVVGMLLCEPCTADKGHIKTHTPIYKCKKLETQKCKTLETHTHTHKNTHKHTHTHTTHTDRFQVFPCGPGRL